MVFRETIPKHHFITVAAARVHRYPISAKVAAISLPAKSAVRGCLAGRLTGLV